MDFGRQAYPRWSGIFSKYSWYFSYVKIMFISIVLKEPPSKLSRIWWFATGPLAFLPIHAAGIYATSIAKAGPTLSDFAISSYIPNVRALAERVNSPRVLEERKTAFFIISQPATPNLARILGTTKEVLAIKQLLQNHDVQVLCLEGEAATVNNKHGNSQLHPFRLSCPSNHQGTAEK